ncbi:MAG: chromophore lyase CpcT/CpeT, partial [Spirulinaceae cyanobacterium]
VRMTTCQVRLNEGNSSFNISNSIFLYQEQALVENLNQPYRQRILRLAPNPYGEGVESKSFKYLQPEALVGLCQQPEANRVVSAQELTDVNCSVFLVPIATIYLGKTSSEGCPTNFRGATKITNLVILNAQGMETWDQGLNEKGEQVWGAENEPFIYTWQEQN